jgi:uncharacterized protein YqiB (DUF1249 family)
MRFKRRYVPDITRLGALGDGNYLRLMKLLPRELDGNSADFQLSSGDRHYGVVRIRLIEACRYTDTIYLEQVKSNGKWLNNPQMTVRLYHDVGMAEVISCCRHRRIQAVNDYPNRFMHHPDEKIQINAFLAEWLDYCLRFGHVICDLTSKL